MTSKRFNPLQVKPVPLESSPHEEHRKLAEDHKHNTLLASIQRYGGSEKIYLKDLKKLTLAVKSLFHSGEGLCGGQTFRV